ncbi:MAG: tetraacyldisaccharide 4'-kinase [Parvibaculum sp.]|uniref:tetraacyldisaccharide 4'-kinase n=1 Tax=Parvibaculum sp. TaxID=2024848 RepID=UPI0035B9EC41
MREPSFWYPARRGSTPLAARLLSPAGFLYGLAGRVRRANTKPERAAVPVICIGNITAGGTGKTPLALTLAERLIARGEKVHFLTRGYGGREVGPIRVDPAHHGAEDVGDEPLLLAAAAPTWVAANRPEGAAAAVRGGAGLILMDDGFQNPSLAKDFSILVVDAATGLGNGRLIPAGPLRENMADALSRANALVLTGRGHAGDGIAARARARGTPVFKAIVRPSAPSDFGEGPYLAFAGIGRPEKFFTTLREMSVELADTVSFPDHHVFRESDALRLLVRARELGARLVTTEKDAARFTHAPAASARARLAAAAAVLPVRALVGDIDGLMAQISDAVARARRR